MQKRDGMLIFIGDRKIQKINLSALHNEEAFGFFTLVKEEMKSLPADPTEGVAPLKDVKVNFTTKLVTYDEVLESSGKLKSTGAVEKADAMADEAWGATNMYVKALARHPDDMIRNAALPYAEVFEKYGNPTQMALNKELGILQNLCTDLEALEDDTMLNFGPWKEYLVETTGLLMDAMQAQADEKSQVQVGSVKQSRLEVESAYRDLVDKVNVVAAYEGDAAYATFIDHLNAMIDRQKVILKTRATNSKKEKKA